MGRRYWIFIELILSITLISGCSQTKKTVLPTETISAIDLTASPTKIMSSVETISQTETMTPVGPEGWQTYRNDEYKFSLMYPPDWITEDKSYQSVLLTPQEEISWQPSAPSDIPKNPAVRIDFGEYIRERIGPTYFPETLDSIILKTWIERQVNNHEANDFSEKSIDDFQAYEITEFGISGCDKVVYWRPTDLDSLVRISTGCESLYLAEFTQIVNSVRQTE